MLHAQTHNAGQKHQDINSGALMHDTHTSKWDSLQKVFIKEFGATDYNNWIAPVECKGVHNNVLHISVATRFIRDWVRTHYAESIRSIWSKNFGAVSRVEVVIAKPTREKKTVTKAESGVPTTASVLENISSPLDPRFTFEQFVVGTSNELAYAAARKIVENEAVTFNPLFVYGGVGFGKTHLLHATAKAIREMDPERRVVYLSAEKFMYQFVKALRSKDMMAFKAQFRSVDVLMIDDIQFICGKESTQEEFFHTFNALIEEKKQIVISSNRAPAELSGLDERLRSRLSGGLSARILPADYDLRLRILQQKSAMIGHDVSQDVLAFLAENIVSSVRELEGALNRLVVHADILQCDITLATAKELLKDLLRGSDMRFSVEEIQKKVADHYDVKVKDMLSPRRAKAIARPRQVAMYLSKVLTQHSLPEIGRMFGGRDHTTIMYGVRKVEELMDKDSAFRASVETVKAFIEG